MGWLLLSPLTGDSYKTFIDLMMQSSNTRKHKVIALCDTQEQSTFLEMTTKELLKELIHNDTLKVPGISVSAKKPDEAEFSYAAMPMLTVLVPNGKPLSSPLQTLNPDGHVAPKDVKLQVPRLL